MAGGEGGRSEEGSAAGDTKPRLGRSRHREARPADESRERPQRWWRGDDREREIERERGRRRGARALVVRCCRWLPPPAVERGVTAVRLGGRGGLAARGRGPSSRLWGDDARVGHLAPKHQLKKVVEM